jgi:hypothetical protein
LFDAVQTKLNEQLNNRTAKKMQSEALLTGRIFDDRGNRMSPSKRGIESKQARYQVSVYVDAALGWQHWFSPQIEVRPEIAYYRSLTANAFNGNANAGIPPSRNWAVIAASDLIFISDSPSRRELINLAHVVRSIRQSDAAKALLRRGASHLESAEAIGKPRNINGDVV